LLFGENWGDFSKKDPIAGILIQPIVYRKLPSKSSADCGKTVVSKRKNSLFPVSEKTLTVSTFFDKKRSVKTCPAPPANPGL